MSGSPGVASDASSAGRARRLLWQFTRFLIVGLVSFGLDYGVFVLLMSSFGVQYLVASTISFSLSLVVNYVLTLKFVFTSRPGRNLLKEFAIYVGLNIVALGLNQLILFAAVDAFGATPLIGKLIATAIVLVYNFISRKLLLERAGGSTPTPPKDDGAEQQKTGGSAL